MNHEAEWSEGSNIPANLSSSDGGYSDFESSSDVERGDIDTFIMPCLVNRAIDMREVVRIIGRVFRGVKTRGPFPREAAHRGAICLCIKIIFFLGDSSGGSASSPRNPATAAATPNLAQELNARMERGKTVLQAVTKHMAHLAIAATVLACKHRGEAVNPETLINHMLFHEKETMEEAGEPVVVMVETQALELLLEQMTIKERTRSMQIPEHFMRPVSMLFTAVLSVSGVDKRHVVQCALLVVDSLYKAGSPIVLHPGDCCVAALIVAAALGRIPVPATLLEGMAQEKANWNAVQVTASREQAADTGEWEYVIPKFDRSVIVGGVKAIVASQVLAETAATMNEALGKFAGAFV